VGEKPVLLFSYGTLQQEEVQLANFGRRLTGEADVLAGFLLGTVLIADDEVVAKSGSREHPIISPSSSPDDVVVGTAFLLTSDELAAADAYEVPEYKRVEVTLRSGRRAWAYVKA
jgi:hypothetical protein